MQLRKELTEAQYNQFDKKVIQHVQMYLAKTTIMDSFNKYHPFLRTLKANITKETLPPEFLNELDDYLNDMKTSDEIKNDTMLKDIINLL